MIDARNLLALLASYLYVGLLLGAAELLRRRLGAGADFTRKAVHIGVGMWSVPTVLLFTDWRWGLVPPATFVVVNYLSYRYGWLEAIEGDEPSNLGTVFFPLSFVVLLGLLWRPGSPDDGAAVAVAGLMAMTWGDAMAAIVGRRWGTRRYRVLGHERTMEGTTAFFFAASAAMTPVLVFLGGIEPHPALALAMIAATVGAGVEAVSLYGSDNLTVPLATAATLYLLLAWWG